MMFQHMLAQSRETNAHECQTQVTHLNNQKVILSRDAIRNLESSPLPADCHH